MHIAKPFSRKKNGNVFQKGTRFLCKAPYVSGEFIEGVCVFPYEH